MVEKGSKKGSKPSAQPETGSTRSGSGEKEGTSDTAQSADATKKSNPSKSTSSMPSTKTGESAPTPETPIAETKSSAQPSAPEITGDSPTDAPTPKKDAKEEAHEKAKEEFLETVGGALGMGSDSEDDDDHYQPIDLVRIIIPVSLCMLLVIAFIILITKPEDASKKVKMHLTPLKEHDVDTGTKVLHALGNVAILIGAVVLMTILVVILYWCYCYKLLLIIMALPVVVINLGFSWLSLQKVFRAYNTPLDHITAFLFSFNFGIIGIMSILGRAPMILQQFYLIYLCATMASVYISFMPEWTLWAFLAFLAIWDLIAVLTPCGPLRILVEMIQKREEDFVPAMIYTTMVNFFMADTVKKDEGKKKAKKKKPKGDGTSQASEEETKSKKKSGSDGEKKEKKRLRLGLGDFVFYSLLTGKATQMTIFYLEGVDWNIVISSCLAIIVGLMATIIILVIRGKALPALPISIALGILFTLVGYYVISGFCGLMNSYQLFL